MSRSRCAGGFAVASLLLAGALLRGVPDLLASNLTGNVTGTGLTGSAPTLISVDEFTGASTHNYEFVVPPGRAGLAPALALVYNSGVMGPGPYGRGWDLGLPYIQRSTRFGQPKFDFTDVFALSMGSGRQDLVMISDNGAGIREYRTEIESFMRIRSYTTGGLTYWTVEDGKGRTYRFGNDGGSGTWVQVGDFRWALDRIEDTHGNYVTLDYYIDTGVLYPKEIRYTGNSATSLPTTNRIEFVWEGRYDVAPERLGVRSDLPDREIRYRLRRLRTWAGTQAASAYIFDYTTGRAPGYLGDLCAGSACGTTSTTCVDGAVATCSNTCDPNTGFCRACSPNCCAGKDCGVNSTTCPNGLPASCSNTCQPADGQCNICTPTCPPPGGGGGCGWIIEGRTRRPRPCAPDGDGALFSLGRPVPVPDPIGGDPVSLTEPSSPAGSMSAAPFSTNDGPSLLGWITRYDGAGANFLPFSTFSYTADVTARKTWGAAVADVPLAFLLKENAAVGRNTDDYGVQIEDVNRDGLPDLVRGYRSTCGGPPIRQVYLNVGGAWQAAPAGTWQLQEDFVIHQCGHEEYDNGLRLLDINGDHLPDLVWSMQGAAPKVWLNNGSGWGSAEPAGRWNVPVNFVVIETDGDVQHSEDLGARFADVNGDGLIDIVTARSSCGASNNHVYLNNGASGWDDSRSTNWQVPDEFIHHYCGGESVDFGARLLDINGDGLADIITSRVRDGAVEKYVWLSRGRADASGVLWAPATGWDIPSLFVEITGSNDDSDDLGVRFADVNGDGRVDMVVARNWEGTAYSCAGGPTTCQAVYLHRAGKGWAEDPDWSARMPAGYYFMEHQAAAEDYDDGVRLADIDGNGTIDFIKSIDNETIPRVYTERRTSADDFSDLMSQVSNGIGGSSAMTYQSSAQYFNGPLGGSIGQTANLAATLPVLSQTTASDGQGGTGHTYTTTYAYAGGFYHDGHRDFRGFRFVRTNLPGGRAYKEQLFVQDPGLAIAPLAGSIERQALRFADTGGIFSLTLNDYDRTDGGPTYFHFLRETQQYLYDGTVTSPIDVTPLPSPVKRTRTAYQLTREAGLEGFVATRKTQSFGDQATPADDVFVTEDLINDQARWQIGLTKHRSSDASDAPVGLATRLAESWTFYDGLGAGLVGAAGNVTSIEESDLTQATPGAPGNRVTAYGYDPYGHVTSTQDPEGHQASTEFDAATQTFRSRETVTTSPGPVQHVTDYVTDPRFGVVTTVTTPGDGQRFLAYDTFGRLSKTWSTSLGSQTLPNVCYQYSVAPTPIMVARFERESDANPGEACGPNGMLGTASFYDGLGRRIQTKTESSEPGYPSHVLESLTYDGEGQIATATKPFYSNGSLTFVSVVPAGVLSAAFEFDPVGRQKGLTLPGIPRLSTTYSGWTRQDLDPEGKRLDTDRDAYGRVVARRTYGDSPTTTTLQYDPLGRLRSVLDTGGNAIQYTYNAFGELLTSSDADGGPVVRDYYKDGTLKSVSDARGAAAQYTYDALHRTLLKTRAQGPSTVTYHYDEAAGRPAGARPIGHVTSVVDSATNVRQEFEYDNAGRLTTARHVVDGVPYSVSEDLDNLGRVKTLHYPGGAFLVNYTYGDNGRVNLITSSAGTLASAIRYTPTGEVDGLTYGNLTLVDNTFDPATDWLRRTFASTYADGATIVDSGYDYSPSGHLTRITDAVHPNTQTFVLDDLYRLRSATATAADSYGTLGFDFDPLGNLTRKGSVNYFYEGTGPHRVTRSSDDLSFGYDASGNITSITNTVTSAVKLLSYDADGRLAQVSWTDGAVPKQSVYTYDPEGSRIKREDTAGAATTRTVLISDLYEETNGSFKAYVYLGAHRIAVYDSVAGLSYLVGDRVGSLAAVTGPSGTLLTRLEYKPYGEVSTMQGPNFSGGFKYAGARLDDATGLYDFGARFYDPGLGRFVGVDPVLGNPLDPRGQNPYGYALGNPVSFADVGGYNLSPEAWKLLIATAIVYFSDGSCDYACAMAISSAVVDGYEQAKQEGKNPYVGAAVGAISYYAGREAGASVGSSTRIDSPIAKVILAKSASTLAREGVKAVYFDGGPREVLSKTLRAGTDAALDEYKKKAEHGRNRVTKEVIDRAFKKLKSEAHAALDRLDQYPPEPPEQGLLSPLVAFGDPSIVQGMALPAGGDLAFSPSSGSDTDLGAGGLVALIPPAAVDPFFSGAEGVPRLTLAQARTMAAVERALAATIAAGVLSSRNGVISPINRGPFGESAGEDPGGVGVPVSPLRDGELMRIGEK